MLFRSRDKVLALGRRYGELDGEVSYYYADAFAKINSTLTEEQRAAMVKLRNLDVQGASCYIYSSPVKEAPSVGGTDRFFPTSKGVER